MRGSLATTLGHIASRRGFGDAKLGIHGIRHHLRSMALVLVDGPACARPARTIAQLVVGRSAPQPVRPQTHTGKRRCRELEQVQRRMLCQRGKPCARRTGGERAVTRAAERRRSIQSSRTLKRHRHRRLRQGGQPFPQVSCKLGNKQNEKIRCRDCMGWIDPRSALCNTNQVSPATPRIAHSAVPASPAFAHLARDGPAFGQ